MAGYSEDLAFIHDAGFGGLARHAAEFLLRTLRAHGIYRGRVVELGCGSGIVAQELTAAGYEVLGVDISPSMIRMARKRAPTARFAIASLLSFDLPECDAVASIGECVNYTFDPANGRAALQRLFRRIHDALSPGGIFVFDFAEPGQISGGPRRQTYTTGDGWAVLLDASEDKRRRLLTRRMVCFRRLGRHYRRWEETHTAKLYKASELLSALRQAGFQARVFRSYGRLRLRPAHAGILAIRR